MPKSIKTRSNDLLSLPAGYTWVYPKKDETIHGLKGRHAWNGEYAIPYRQVNYIAGNKKSYREYLAKANHGTKDNFTQSITNKSSLYERYTFTNSDDALNFMHDVPQTSEHLKVFMIGLGELDDEYEEQETSSGLKYARLTDTYTGGERPQKNALPPRFQKNLKSFNGLPHEYIVTVLAK